MRTLIKNADTIVTCDAQDHIYHHCDMLIEDQRIVSIGQNHLPEDNCQVIDAAGKIVYPGLINTHHHFFQSFVRNFESIECYNMSLTEWLDHMYRIFVLMDSEDIYHASLTAMADLVKHGCTTAFDLQYCYTPYTGYAPIDRQMDAAEQIGIRFHAGRGVNTLPGKLGSTIPDGMVETTEAYLNDARRLIRKYHDDSRYSMRQIVLAPCQPMNCYEETFRESVKLAREYGVHLHTHLGEGENQIIRQRYGMDSIDWCKKHGFVGEDVWFAHCWEFGEEEFKRMADLGCGISHCPEAAMLAGAPILPLKRLKELGIPVGLGCDGSATNDGSNLLSCIRTGFLLQAFFSKQRGGSVHAYDLLKAATVNGAKILGRADIGTLEEGKAADLFLIDGMALDLIGAGHEAANLPGRVGISEVWLTMVNGEVVYKDGQLTKLNEAEAAKNGQKVFQKLLEKIPEYKNKEKGR